MWTRKELKTRAKEVLKGTYWKAFLVGLVLMISGGGDVGGINFNSSGGNQNRESNSYVQNIDKTSVDTAYDRLNVGLEESYNDSGIGYDTKYVDRHTNIENVAKVMTIVTLAVVSIVLLVILAYRVFLGYSLEVGSKKYYIEASRGNADMNLVSFGFNKPNYKNILGVMVYRDAINFLWFLALIIPGIIKRYAYLMIPYLLADNPDLDRKEALIISTEMMKGEKFKTFVLELSFIGWYILGILAFCVGVLFVNPYVFQTKAELYLVLKNKVDRAPEVFDMGPIQGI